MRWLVMLTACVLVTGSALAEDKLTLKDGQVVRGTIVSETDDDVQVDSEGETISVPTWAIESIERAETDPEPAGDDAGEEGEIVTNKAIASSEAPASEELAGEPQESEESPAPADRREKASRELLEWIDVCIEHLHSKDKDVRAGAMAALKLAGPAARAALEKVAESDTASAALARRMLQSPLVQDRRGGGGGGGGRRPSDTIPLGRILKLTDDQRPQFDAIVSELQEKHVLLTRQMRAGGMTQSEAEKQIAAAYHEAGEALSTVLDAQQMDQFLDTTSQRTKGQ